VHGTPTYRYKMYVHLVLFIACKNTNLNFSKINIDQNIVTYLKCSFYFLGNLILTT